MTEDFPVYKGKRARGGSFELGPEGKAICLYLDGLQAGSALGNLGMPAAGSGDADGPQVKLAEIGKIMRDIDSMEEEITGTKPRYNRLKRRFAAYMAMIEARNLLPLAQFDCDLAIHRINLGLATLEDLQEAEDKLEQVEVALDHATKENERLRKGSIYLKLIGEFGRLLKERRVFS